VSETTPKQRRYRRIALEIGAVVLVVIAVRTWQTRDAPDGLAPPLAGPTIDGAPLALDATPGQPVLVHFWATWCGVCQAEEGTIDALARDHRVLTVAAQSGGAAQVGAYLREEGLSFPVIVDPRGELAQRWGVRAFPTSFVIAPDGTVRNVEVGYTTSLGLRARLWLAGVL
jgi:thiol-disulfide isomerase/thioredoxin